MATGPQTPFLVRCVFVNSVLVFLGFFSLVDSDAFMFGENGGTNWRSWEMFGQNNKNFHPQSCPLSHLALSFTRGPGDYRFNFYELQGKRNQKEKKKKRQDKELL